MIIFHAKTECTIKDLTVPNDICLVTKVKAWMDERLMTIWYQKTLLILWTTLQWQCCISEVQSLDVCINELFKSILRECWEHYVVNLVKDAWNEARNNPSFKLSCLTRQDIVNWVHQGYVFLQESKTMIQRSFEVCCITTTNPGFVRNDDIFKRIMTSLEVHNDRTDMCKELCKI